MYITLPTCPSDNNGNSVILKNVRSELMQSICAVDGKPIKAFKSIHNPPPPKKKKKKNQKKKPKKNPLYLCIENTPIQLSNILIVWLTSFPTLLQHLAFHADRSYQAKVSVGGRACSKVWNDTLNKTLFPVSIGFSVSYFNPNYA